MLVYSTKYSTDLLRFGITKSFALDRAQKILAALRAEFNSNVTIIEPSPITWGDMLLVHSFDYVCSLQKSEIWKEILELTAENYDASKATRPLSELFDDVAIKCGGTMLAVELAMKYGLSANLGGGYHHAFPERARGFCSLNDIAIAIKKAQKIGLFNKCMIVDVDFHQGDGTAFIFKNDPSVFTISIHSEEGWPDEKQESDIDVSLLSSQVHLYQKKLEQAIELGLSKFVPEFVMFVAGSDAYELDTLPGTRFFKLTLEQMRARDEYVIDIFANQNIPITTVFAGGYGPDVWEVHYFQICRILKHLNHKSLMHSH